MMREYEIWLEGHMTMDGGYYHSFIGFATGTSFEDAVRSFYRNNPAYYFDDEYLRKLHPSEAEAIKHSVGEEL